MTAEEFIEWALDPARTVEETFTAEVLVEAGLQAWKGKNVPAKQRDWCREMSIAEKRRQLRRHNPAYRPQLRREEVELAAPELARSQSWTHMSNWDRSLGDLKALEVLTEVETLHVSDVTGADLTPLATLPKLRELHLSIGKPVNTAALAACTALEQLDMRCGIPWPETPPLHLLPRLKSLSWNANLFLLEEIPRLPAVERFVTGSGMAFNELPLRNLSRLPEMPVLRYMKYAPAGDLRGIERSPDLLGLDLAGAIPSLEPLTALKKLTHLKLTLQAPLSLRPLASLPELRWLLIRSDLPFDFSPLGEAPRLHALYTPRLLPRDGDERNGGRDPLDVVTVRALLEPWDGEFAGLCPAPRPVPPLRMVVRRNKVGPSGGTAFPPTFPPFSENPHVQAAYLTWAWQQVNKALDDLLGDGWNLSNLGEERAMRKLSGYEDIPGADHGLSAPFPCQQAFEINSAEAAERLPEVLDTVRRVWATLPGQWSATIMVCLDPEWVQDADRWKSPLRRRWEEYEEDNRYFEEERRKKREYQDRVLRLQMAQEAGHEINPGDFAPDARTHEIWQTDEQLKQEQDEINDGDRAAGHDDDNEGGVAVKEADPKNSEPEKHPLAEAYNLYATLYFDTLVVLPHQAMAATILMGEPPEDSGEEETEKGA